MSDNKFEVPERTAALLRAYRGDPIQQIAADLGVPENDIQVWLRNASTQPGERPPAPTNPTPSRQRYAQDLLFGSPFLRVYRPAEEDPDYDDSEYSLAVHFIDTAALFEDLVAESVDFISALPSVVDVAQDDRDVIRVAGDIDAGVLQAHLRGWWTSKLRNIAGPDATDPR